MGIHFGRGSLRVFSALSFAMLSATFAAPSAFGQAAGGYDFLEVTPPPGYLARRSWLAEHGVSVDIR